MTRINSSIGPLACATVVACTAAGFAGCTASSEALDPTLGSKAATKFPDPNFIDRDAFDTSAIEVRVPANTWAMVRLDYGSLTDPEGQAAITVAARPMRDSTPWAAFSYAKRDLERPSASFSFYAFRPDGGDLAGMEYRVSPTPLPDDGSEMVVVLGAMDAPATFYVGGNGPSSGAVMDRPDLNVLSFVDSNFDQAAYLQRLEDGATQMAARPRIKATTDLGKGGFAGTAFLVYTDGKFRFETVRGLMNLSHSSVLLEPGLATVAYETRVDNRYFAPAPGPFNSSGVAVYQAGAGDYSYSFQTPDFGRSITSVQYGLGSYGRIATGFPGTPAFVEAGTMFFHNRSAVTQPGELSTTIYNRFTGKDGGDLAGVGGPALITAVPSAYIFRWGYFPCDCESRFGWKLDNVDFR